MNTTRQTLVLVFSLALVAWTTGSVSAQGKGGVVTMQAFSMSGRITSLAPGAIIVQPPAGGAVRILVSKPGESHVTYSGGRLNITTLVTVTGELPPSALQPSAYVKFSAKVDKRGTVKEPVEKLTLFRPKQGYKPGLFPDGEEGRYLISGVVNSTRKGSLVVRVPRGKGAPRGLIKAKLSKEAVVLVDASDYRLVRPGDEITIMGGKIKNDILGRKIDIKLIGRTGKKQDRVADRGKKGKGKDPFKSEDPKGKGTDKGKDKKGDDEKKTEPEEDDPFLKETDDDKDKSKKDDGKKADTDPKTEPPKNDGSKPDGKPKRGKNPKPKVLIIK